MPRRASNLGEVALLTGYEDAPDVGVACREGVVYEVVGKPWSAAQLKDAIGRAVKLAHAAGD